MTRRPLSHQAFRKDPSLSNAAFAKWAWKNQPHLMDYLDPRSPLRERRLLQRQIYEKAFTHYYPRLSRGMKILDVGCGVGRFLLPLVARGCRVTGIDFDFGHLVATRRHARRVRAHAPSRTVAEPSGSAASLLAQARAEHLPFMAGSFDAVLAIETLSYVSSASKALREIRRVLRPKGLLLLSVESRLGGIISDAHLSLEQIQPAIRTGVCHVPGSFYSRYFNESELLRLLQSNGFRVLHFQPAHFVLDGPLDPLVANADLHKPNVREAVLRLEHTLASLPSLHPLARTWTVAARTIPPSLVT